MRITDLHVVSKTGNAEGCEDYLVTTDDIAAIIDGATNKSDGLLNGKTPGKMAASTLADTIKSFPKKITRSEAVQEFTGCLARFYKQNNIYDYMSLHQMERASADLAVYSDYHGEIWIIGDCQCIANNRLYSSRKTIDEIAANTRALYIELELIAGKTVDQLMERDTGREYIESLLRMQAFFQNSQIDHPYSFGAVDGFEISANHIQTITVQANSKYIVLASDGYPELMSSFEASEKRLKEFLEKDPLCIRIHKLTKGLSKHTISYDDRTYLKIEL
ncbi:MAG: hypothetical protein L0220_02760 [Acidobacteria bacterium]|nr:hypothetical protein [Acidobacteriota bacterium]